MKAAEFKDWIKSIERMSRGQRDKLRERLERKAGADTIIELIEQGQNDERICPYCQGTELYRWGGVRPVSYNATDAATAITHLMP